MSSGPAEQATDGPVPGPPGYVGQLPLSLKAGWGVGAFGSLGMLWLANVFLMFFLVNHLGMNPALAGIILFITRIYDVISDPLIGHLSDNSSSRWGRRRPWMFVGAFASGLAAIFVFNVPAFSSDNTTAAYELVVLLVYFTGFTLFYVPFMAMPAEMTDDYSERTSIMSFRVGYSFAAGIIIAAGMPALISRLGGDRAAYEFAATIAGVLITVSMLMTVLFTRRARELKRVHKESLYGQGIFRLAAAQSTFSFPRRAEVPGVPERRGQWQRLFVLHDLRCATRRNGPGFLQLHEQCCRALRTAAVDQSEPRQGQEEGLSGRLVR